MINDRDRKRELGNYVLSVQLDDDDDDKIVGVYIYIYIYIYINKYIKWERERGREMLICHYSVMITCLELNKGIYIYIYTHTLKHIERFSFISFPDFKGVEKNVSKFILPKLIPPEKTQKYLFWQKKKKEKKMT